MTGSIRMILKPLNQQISFTKTYADSFAEELIKLFESGYKKEDIRQGNIKLIIDLKPALDVQKLDDRILRDFSLEKNKIFKNSLDNLLPQKMISTVIELSGIDQNKKVNEITREEVPWRASF